MALLGSTRILKGYCRIEETLFIQSRQITTGYVICSCKMKINKMYKEGKEKNSRCQYVNRTRRKENW